LILCPVTFILLFWFYVCWFSIRFVDLQFGSAVAPVCCLFPILLPNHLVTASLRGARHRLSHRFTPVTLHSHPHTQLPRAGDCIARTYALCNVLVCFAHSYPTFVIHCYLFVTLLLPFLFVPHAPLPVRWFSFAYHTMPHVWCMLRLHRCERRSVHVPFTLVAVYSLRPAAHLTLFSSPAFTRAFALPAFLLPKENPCRTPPPSFYAHRFAARRARSPR